MRVLLPWGGHCSTNSSDCDESSSGDSDSSSCSVSSSTTDEEVDDDDQDHEEVVHNPSSSFAEQAPPLPADRDHSTLLAPVSHSQESPDGLVVLAEEEEGRQEKQDERHTLPSTLEDPSSPRPPRSEIKAPSSDQVFSAPSSASFDSIDQPGKTSPPVGKKVAAKRKSELHTLLVGSHQYFPSQHPDWSAGGAFPLLEESSTGSSYKKRLRSSDVKKPPAVAAKAELPLKPPSTAIMAIAGRFKSDSDDEGEPQPQGDDDDDEALLLLENTPARIWIHQSSSSSAMPVGSMVVAENDPPPAWNSDGPIGGTAQYHHHHHHHGGVASLNHPAMTMMMSSHTKSNNDHNNNTASSSSFLERKRPPPCLEAFQDKLKQQGLEMVEQEGDGNCLFRAVSLQVYGTADSHGELRERVMDFMARNEEHYSSFVDGNFRDYILRKRGGGVHGNHAEIQAISELYNRPVEVYQDDGTPMNIFHQEYKTADPPIRLSYHDGNHYNAVIDPLVPTAGLGLGLPGLQPGLADQLQITKAKTESDQLADQMELDRIIQESKADFKDSQDDELQRVLKESSMDYVRFVNGCCCSGLPCFACDYYLSSSHAFFVRAAFLLFNLFRCTNKSPWHFPI
jgi:hypothetical protein